MDHSKDTYNSIFSIRYKPSPEILTLFSEKNRIITWRKLWIYLATAQKELGLAIDESQINELTDQLENIDWDYAAQKEKEFRHDVMAHIHAFKHVCPSAGGILHQGATSAFVQDNTELILIKEALRIVGSKVLRCIDRLAKFAEKWKSEPTVGRTHYQPASLTTIGKRCVLWIQDLLIAYDRLDYETKSLRFRGVKGATGTKDSFLKLFDGDISKVESLNRRVTDLAGFEKSFLVSGQTYPRLVDATVLNATSCLAAAVNKICTDIRMLQCFNEIQEPFESSQIGSSAMPWKRNPIRCERVCGFARFLLNLNSNALQTAAVQGFERTLDDSSNKRIVIPEAFICADALLMTFQNIVEGLVVNQKVVEANVHKELQFVSMEAVLMSLVKQGLDRQDAHEKIRGMTQSAASRLAQGEDVNLLDEISQDPYFQCIKGHLKDLFDPKKHIGCNIHDVDMFLRDEVGPLIKNIECISETVTLAI